MQKYIEEIHSLTAKHKAGEISDSEFAARVAMASTKYKAKALHGTTDRPLPSRMGCSRKTTRTLNAGAGGLH